MPRVKGPIRQSAVLAWRIRKKRMEVALVTSLDTGRWVLPKGHVERGMTPRESAAAEAYEEAGLYGTVGKQPIGEYDYQKTELKGGGHCRVEVFPMKVRRAVSNWPEKKLRKRKWMPLETAADSVTEEALSTLMLEFGGTVEA